MAEKFLADAGFACERLDCGSVANLLATFNPSGAKSLVLAGHVDVVPPGDEQAWDSPPFEPTERDGLLFGRGACDMKSAVACMLAAAAEYARKPSAGCLAVLLTSDEEGEAVAGTSHVVDVLAERGWSYDYGIVGEPSCERLLGDTVRIGRRGSLVGEVEFIGEQGHIAYPDQVRNPIPVLAAAIAAMAERKFDAPEGLEPTLVAFVSIAADAGATNIVPRTAQGRFGIRYSSADTPAQLKAWAEEVFAAQGLPYSCKWRHHAVPYASSPEGELVGQLQKACRRQLNRWPELSSGGGASDGRFLRASCAELVEFGCVGTSMHKANEHVALDDLGPLAAIYLACARGLLA